MNQGWGPEYQNVSCECRGQRFQCAWYEAHAFVHTASACGSRSAKRVRKEPLAVAQKLFAELCKEWCRR